MSVYPVIMCGGSGTRLWPASRPDRPKQFIPLIGERSSFQETVERVAGIEGASDPIIVAGIAHRPFLEAQLADLGRPATLILEPMARDSCAAMAAAAAFIAAKDPEGIAIFVSADHHIPDAAAFRVACEIAAREAARGRIVTLGVRPTSPATAFGYIQPAGRDAAVTPVIAFVEKPNLEKATQYLADGYLWNSGNFIVEARTLLAEIEAFAPDVGRAARDAVLGGETQGDVLILGAAFEKAPKISIDFAVMENTTRASVAPVTFAWSDIGAWDAVWSSSPRDAQDNAGDAVFAQSTGNLVRAPVGTKVAILGVKGLAVIVDGDAVLVCDLTHSQSVKTIGETMKSTQGHVAAPFSTLRDARAWFDRWIRTSALPLWWSLGADHQHGGFREVLSLDGADLPRRGRVQPRQVYAFATAGAAGWSGPWAAAVDHGLAFMEAHYRRPDGLIRTLAGPDGSPLDETAKLYDQAFVLLAFAATGRESEALAHVARLDALRNPAGGWREAGEQPFQSNPHMHLFEAMLAWEKVGKDLIWRKLADEIAQLALSRFIDAKSGLLREFFAADWSPAKGEDGRKIEPGHQFEWCGLLDQWGASRDREDARAAARKLFEIGLKGVDPMRGVAVNGLWDDFSVRDGGARLWVQTEYLKAGLLMGRDDVALDAAKAVARYLDQPVPGAWRDLMDQNGALANEPSPASTLYHLVSAWRQLSS